MVSLIGRLRDELFKGEFFFGPVEVKALVEQWRKTHNHIRPHSALCYRPSAPEAIALTSINPAEPPMVYQKQEVRWIYPVLWAKLRR